MSERDTDAYQAAAERVFTPNYRPAPIVVDHGEGSRLVDIEGRRYLDMMSGIAVSALGHAHPKLVEAIREQAGKVLHTSNLYFNAPSIELAERIVDGCFADSVYFCNSGAEANEAAIKLARKRAFDAGDTERVEIISFDGSFHGRTFAALTATAQPKYHQGFHPLPGGFTYLPFGDAGALELAISKKTAAVIIEPIQGEGGVRTTPSGYLEAIRSACDRVGALLIFDEVQVGMGRTGTLFAHQHEGVTPDIMSLAKGIGGGLPLGAMVATEAAGASLTFGSHATTYGGNPVACAAGAGVMDAVRSQGFLDQVKSVGDRLAKGLTRIGEATGLFKQVRGRGLLIGAEVDESKGITAKDVVVEVRSRNVLVHVAGPKVVRLAPPLILTQAEADEALEAIEASARVLVKGAVA